MKNSKLTWCTLLSSLGLIVGLCLLYNFSNISVRASFKPNKDRVVSTSSKPSTEKLVLREAEPVESAGNVQDSDSYTLPLILAVLGLLFFFIYQTFQEPSNGYVNVFDLFRILPNGP